MMKKKLCFLMMAVFFLGMTACSDDDDDKKEAVAGTYTGTITVTDEAGTPIGDPLTGQKITIVDAGKDRINLELKDFKFGTVPVGDLEIKNVAVNDKGVLAHNSYTTGEIKDSRADRDAYIIAVLAREGRLKCSTKVWTEFSEIVERKHDFHVTESIRQLSMNFDYKRCPIVETSVDTPVQYTSADGQYSVDTVIAEYDTRPFNDAEEFLNYRNTMQNEDCVKVTADLERVKIKSTVKTKGYIGKDLDRKILLSILMGYRSGLYQIPALDGLKQSEVVETVNSWGISPITLNDWKNCSSTKRQENMLPRELVEETLQKILNA